MVAILTKLRKETWNEMLFRKTHIPCANQKPHINQNGMGGCLLNCRNSRKSILMLNEMVST